MSQDYSRTHSKRDKSNSTSNQGMFAQRPFAIQTDDVSNSTSNQGIFTQRPFAVQTRLDGPLQGGMFAPRPFAPTIQTKSIKDRVKSKFRSLFGKRQNEDERFQGSRPRRIAVYENETEHRETSDELVGELRPLNPRGNAGVVGPFDDNDQVGNTDVEGEGEYTKPVGELRPLNPRGNDGVVGPSDDNDQVGNTDVEGEGEYTKYDDDIDEFYEPGPSNTRGDQDEKQIEGDGERPKEEIQIEGEGEIQIEGEGEKQIEGEGEIFKPKGEKKHPRLRSYRKRNE